MPAAPACLDRVFQGGGMGGFRPGEAEAGRDESVARPGREHTGSYHCSLLRESGIGHFWLERPGDTALEALSVAPAAAHLIKLRRLNGGWNVMVSWG